ncbi:MAG: hypothetical protein AAFQ43_08520, partial [Bacteroidota bacterium]
YSTASGDVTVRAGVGLVAVPPLHLLLRRDVSDLWPDLPPRVVLTLGADAMPGLALASVEAHVGLNRALARNEIARQRHELAGLAEALGGLVLDGETVASVEASGETEVPLEALFALVTVRLRDGRVLTVASRDPYPDCFGCGSDLLRAGAYPATPEARPVWISLSGLPDQTNSVTSPSIGFAHALDPDALLAAWRERGVLDLRLPEDAADRAASGVALWHDLSLLGGIADELSDAPED